MEYRKGHSLAVWIKRARGFAAEHHGDQKYGHKPYLYHLDAVLSVAFEFGITDEDIIIATLLHDVVEDTEVTREQVSERFSNRVGDLVYAVTNEPGKNRKVRAKKTYPKILGIEGAVKLKLADRIANVRSCWLEAQEQDANKRNKSLIGMYKKEYGGFRKALKQDLDSVESAMWNELDKLLAWEP